MREYLCAMPASQAATFISIFRLLWASMQGRTEGSVIEHPFPSGADLAANHIWNLEVPLVRN